MLLVEVTIMTKESPWEWDCIHVDQHCVRLMSGDWRERDVHYYLIFFSG